MVLYEAVIYIGLMMGSLSSGYIYQDYRSSTLIFSISAFCLLFATLIVIFVIPESLNYQAGLIAENNDQNEIPEDRRRINNIFDWKLLKDMYKTCFRYREYEGRSIVLSIVTILVMCAFVVGKSQIVYSLFEKKNILIQL